MRRRRTFIYTARCLNCGDQSAIIKPQFFTWSGGWICPLCGGHIKAGGRRGGYMTIKEAKEKYPGLNVWWERKLTRCNHLNRETKSAHKAAIAKAGKES